MVCFLTVQVVDRTGEKPTVGNNWLCMEAEKAYQDSRVYCHVVIYVQYEYVNTYTVEIPYLTNMVTGA